MMMMMMMMIPKFDIKTHLEM